MESPRNVTENSTFNTPEEELQYLRTRTEEMEKVLGQERNSFEKERIAKKQVQEYVQSPQEQVLPEENHTNEQETIAHALGLKKEEHDTQIDELVHIAQNQSIHKALNIASKMGVHIEDDFHKIITQYILEGSSVKGMMLKGTDLWRATHMTLFEISIGVSKGREEQDKASELEKLLGAMEQFYLGTLSVIGGKEGMFSTGKKSFTIEVASRAGSEEVVFYVSVPAIKAEIFIRHLVSMFPEVVVDEKRDDYNIFNNDGGHAVAEAHFNKNDIYPIKTYKKFTHDPMNAMMSTFAKLGKHNEGAAIQIVIGDEGTKYNSRIKSIINAMRKGNHEKYAIGKNSGFQSKMWVKLKKSMGFLKDQDAVDQTTLDMFVEKASRRIVPTTIRVVASASDELRAHDIVEQITSSFNQFDDGQGNGFVWKFLKGRKMHRAIRDFIMRVFGASNIIQLSVEELTTIYHLTGRAVRIVRDLKKSKLASIPAPIEVSEAEGNGIVLGVNKIGTQETKVYFNSKDRMRHFYEIGQTGTGKSFLMRQMIIQDIHNGDGVCYLDPHGVDVEEILASVPEHRRDDVIYFDPADTEMPMALNMLEYDINKPEQKTMVVDEMLGVFKTLYSDTPEAMGPQFEQYFRNAMLAVIEDPATGSTVIDLVRVLADEDFRNMKLSRCNNPLVVQFWKKIADQTSGEYGFQNMIPYITNKFDIFLTNEIMRPIVAQEKSSFNFREIMDSKKILLVNLSKGKLGDINSNFLGLIIIGKLLLAALSRADTKEEDLSPFYLYIDEFHNFMTPSIATILSEARKYKLSLNMAHQYIKQLDDNIRDAVFGNVGTKCVFRISHEDAEFIEKDFATDLSAAEIADVPNRHAYISMLVNGTPVRPFDIETTLIHEPGDDEYMKQLKEESKQKYGRPRAEIEAEVRAKYQQLQDAEDKDKKKEDDPFAGF